MNFYESIADYYDYIFPENEIKYQFFKNSLKKKKNQLLDIGCSTGGFSALVGENNKVIAIDLDTKMIEIARKKVNKSNIEFIEMDMLNIEEKLGQYAFDIVTCFGNTLVHLETSCCISNFFSQVKRVLKPDGIFLFQIINYDRIFQNKVKELPTIENQKIKFERYYKHLPDNYISFNTVLTIKENNKKIINEQKLYGIKKDEIINLLQVNGFKNIELYGSFKQEPYTKDSYALVVKAQ